MSTIALDYIELEPVSLGIDICLALRTIVLYRAERRAMEPCTLVRAPGFAWQSAPTLLIFHARAAYFAKGMGFLSAKPEAHYRVCWSVRRQTHMRRSLHTICS